MPLFIVPVLVVLALIVLVPVSIVQRYRVGTSRQRARGWLITLNLFGIALSTVVFLASAAVTSLWVPGVFGFTAAGLGTGAALGLVGLWLTRWEATLDGLYYTPNRWLVLAVTLVVTARIGYGFWRGWTSWRAGMEGGSWYVATGLAGAMAAGAIVLGYYFVYWIGVRRRSGRRTARRLGRA